MDEKATPVPLKISNLQDELYPRDKCFQRVTLVTDHMEDGTPYYTDFFVGSIQGYGFAEYIVEATNSHASLKSELEALRGAAREFRDTILHDRGALAELTEGNSDFINAVLGEFDATFGQFLPSELSEESGKGENVTRITEGK
jgi:hypothetical protein